MDIIDTKIEQMFRGEITPEYIISQVDSNKIELWNDDEWLRILIKSMDLYKANLTKDKPELREKRLYENEQLKELLFAEPHFFQLHQEYLFFYHSVRSGDFLFKATDLEKYDPKIFEKRYNDTTNIHLKIRYCEALIQLTKNLKWFIDTKDIYIKYLDYFWSLDSSEGYIKGIRIINQLRIYTVKTKQKIDPIIDLHFRLFNILKERHNLRWGIDLFESLLEISKTVLKNEINSQRLEDIKKYTNESIKYFKEQHSYNLVEHYSLSLLEFSKIFSPDEIREKERQLVIDIIEEGENHPMHLVKANFFEKALKKAQDLGFSEFYEDLKLRIRKNYQIGIQSEMAIIDPGEEIMNEIKLELDRQINKFIELIENKTTDEQLDILLSSFKLPSFDYWTNYTEQNPNPSIMKQILPTHLMNHELSKGSFSETDETILEIQTNFNRETSLLESQIYRCFKILAGNEDFFEICKKRIISNKYFSQNTSKSLLFSIERLKIGDFRAAYPYLLFTIEPVLRDILKINGIGDFKQSGDEQQFYVGKRVLEKISENSILNLDYCKVWELTFFHPDHSNYRNAFAHGFQIFDAISAEVTFFLLYLYLRLPKWEK